MGSHAKGHLKTRVAIAEKNGSLQFVNFEVESEAVAFAGHTLCRSLSGSVALFPVSFHSIGRVRGVRSSGFEFDSSQRVRVVALLESRSQTAVHEIDSCLADMVDHMPCDDPRINSQLSREMNYYKGKALSEVGRNAT
ncbi:Methyltransferase [Forsythia ovata]|uniref:Methyltransferase n=1 Tax=Forsythia ovata TaxID=205694 RepID=A0ABD1VJY6_9LAMI